MANISSINNDGKLIAGMEDPNSIVNVGINLASNVFSIRGARASWSSTNPGYITMPSATAGDTCVLKFITNVTFNDNGHASPSFPVNCALGITRTVNWASDMPIFLYCGNVDDTSANAFFFFARDPRMTTTPAVGYIHDFDAAGATADSQNHICHIGTHRADIASVPCRCIGSFRATWVT